MRGRQLRRRREEGEGVRAGPERGEQVFSAPHLQCKGPGAEGVILLGSSAEWRRLAKLSSAKQAPNLFCLSSSRPSNKPLETCSSFKN
jgi:hypothetical protein